MHKSEIAFDKTLVTSNLEKLACGHKIHICKQDTPTKDKEKEWEKVLLVS